MGVFSWLRGGRARAIRAEGGAGWTMTVGQKLELLGQMFVKPSRSGKSVTPEIALQVSTVFDCCRIIAEGIAQAPLKLHKTRAAGGSDPAIAHPLYDLLYRRPNGWQTSFGFRETLVFHMLLTGNFFAFKNVVRGHVIELIPLLPSSVRIIRRPDYSLAYTVRGENGQEKTFAQDVIWHVRGPSWNSYAGLDACKLAREEIGLAMAAEETQADLQRRGAKMPGVIGVEGTLSAMQFNDITKWLKDNALAVFDDLGLLILDRSAKFQSIGMSSADAQTIETRRMQVEEICRRFRVLPIMVGHTDKTATYASAEQMFIAHVVHTLAPWAERIEQAIDNDLISRADWRNGYYAKFNLNALLRGALKDEAEYFARALGSGGTRGWLTQNEVRALKEMNPLDGGDELPMPTNVAIQPAEKPAAETEAEPEPAS